jgi:thiamine kinase-like enzyme
MIQEFYQGAVYNDISPAGLSAAAKILLAAHQVPIPSDGVPPSDGEPYKLIGALIERVLRAGYVKLSDKYAQIRDELSRVLAKSEPVLQPVQQMIDQDPLILGSPVISHGDVITANFFATQVQNSENEKLKLLDWEFAHIGHKYEDLSGWIIEDGFDDDQEMAILQDGYGLTMNDNDNLMIWAFKVKRSLQVLAVLTERLIMIQEGNETALDDAVMYVSILEGQLKSLPALVARRPSIPPRVAVQ